MHLCHPTDCGECKLLLGWFSRFFFKSVGETLLCSRNGYADIDLFVYDTFWSLKSLKAIPVLYSVLFAKKFMFFFVHF